MLVWILIVRARSPIAGRPYQSTCSAASPWAETACPRITDVLVVAVGKIRSNHLNVVDTHFWMTLQLRHSVKDIRHIVVRVALKAMDEYDKPLNVGRSETTAHRVKGDIVCETDVLACGIFDVEEGDFASRRRL